MKVFDFYLATSTYGRDFNIYHNFDGKAHSFVALEDGREVAEAKTLDGVMVAIAEEVAE